MQEGGEDSTFVNSTKNRFSMPGWSILFLLKKGVK